MPISSNTYGKSRVRLVRMRRQADATEFFEWTVNILFEGDFAAAYADGNNAQVLPTDSMKNTVYSLARSSRAACQEEFAQELAAYFLANNAEVSRVTVEILAKAWQPVVLDGKPHASCFHLAGNELQTAFIDARRGSTAIRSGVRDLLIMKTSDSGFSGFKRDRLTTLKQTSDRLLGTALRAEWTYITGVSEFAALRSKVREQLLATFAAHHSLSVQHTLHAMGEAVLQIFPEVSKIKLTMPNLHCLPVDLSPFGQDNPNEIFVPIDEPHGYIEAEMER